MECSYEINEDDEPVRKCKYPSEHSVTLAWVDDKGHIKEEAFGYCELHWPIVKSYYRESEVESP